MNQKKRVLILSASYGQGHNSVGRAVEAAIAQKAGKNAEIVFVDLANELRRYTNSAIIKTYERTTRYTPKLYGFLFQATDNPYSIKLLKNLISSFNYMRLKKYLIEQNPDIIISLYPAWSHLVKVVYKADKKPFIFVNILTDSTLVHSSWIDNYADYLIVADQDTAKACLKQGANQKKIITLGYPVSAAYENLPTQAAAKSKLGLQTNKKTVLYLASGDHLISARQTVAILAKLDLNLAVICGRNKRLSDFLKKKCKNYNNIHILGWSDQVPIYIAASDIVITKAGGSTVMECLAAQRPIIINRIVPGQEEGNIKLVQKHQLGLVCTSTKQLAKKASYLLAHYKHYQFKLQQFAADPQAANKTADFILSIIK